jgi:adenylate cyclase, class 2
METELEAKWLNIKANEIRASLERIGAKLIAPERMMIRRNFDYPDKHLETIGGWVRVRNEGNKITLSYKQLSDRTLHGTKEVSLVVDSFDAACIFLESIGLKQTSVQETKRESWELGSAQIEIDTWPWIPSFVEIEALNETELFDVASKLGLARAQALHGSVEIAYQSAYDVTEEEIDGWEEIRFIDVPGWLSVKAKETSLQSQYPS